ncbi:hypothetical protein BC936DRAFT_139841 [Jimgerdemannia flammicorona]|uniref:Uncharacterized protein n=1 Tax=Jimgerdemannia flammicorona TaxID=994334 RepID=A0A433B937_9FUNG|nr:hypothetical protein BC936DRAFT_139841 [Jimgerdemannia flammicorona]
MEMRIILIASNRVSHQNYVNIDKIGKIIYEAVFFVFVGPFAIIQFHLFMPLTHPKINLGNKSHGFRVAVDVVQLLR